MGIFERLFGSKKQKQSKIFEEKTVTTENINQELLDVSKEFSIPVSSLDFDILNVKTFVSFGDEEFIEADGHMIELIKTEKFFLNPDNKIKQTYEIKIKKHKISDTFEIRGEIKINKLFTKAQFILSKQSVLKTYNEKIFLNEINKKKLKNSLLIGIFDEEMKKEIKKLSENLLKGGLKNDFTINLCSGIDPIPTAQGKIVFSYKEKKKTFKKELIYPIKNKETLIEITKSKKGKPGRNCKGEFINIENLKDFEIPVIKFDKDTIEKTETENRIVYTAKIPGYVVQKDNIYMIKDRLEIRKIDIKTGHVKQAHKSNIKMKIKESDYMKEAVGDGMTVEAKEVIIKGNTGSASKIKADVLQIKGKTHKKSIINAKKAFINTHRGELKADTVEINTLEGGKVKAEKVHIKNAIGGKITAKEIYIENLFSHTKIYALKIIEIKNLKGEENLFCISPEKVLDNTDIDSLQKEILKIEQNINILNREIKKMKKTLIQNKQNYENLKQLYKENRKNRRKTSASVLMKLKKYNIYLRQFNSLTEKKDKLNKNKEKLLEEIESIQNAVYNAKIIFQSRLKPFNRIEFDLLEPYISLKYDTKGDEGVCGFKLKFDETPKIVKIKADNDSGT